MKATLFDIVGEMQDLYLMATTAIDEAETEEERAKAEQALVDTLEGMKGDLETKSSGYIAVINRLDAEMKKADEVAKAYTAIKKSRENAIKRMKDTLLFAMDQLEYSEMPAGDLTIKIKKNGGQAPLTITGDVPDNMTKITIEPDNAKIRAFLKDQPDNACEWAHLEERGRHIEIK